ncbi:hypothetical protein Tco_1211864 [Tanacetum coccineum]
MAPTATYWPANLAMRIGVPDNKDKKNQLLIVCRPGCRITYIFIGRYGVSVSALTKDHKGNMINALYPEKTNTPYWKYINGKNAYELKGKFLDDLHNNAFDGTNGGDAVKHIKYFLRIVDPIDLPNDYWKMVSDEIELPDDESSDLEETDHDDEQEIEDMDSESAHMVAASKVPMLKPGEFKIWRMMIELYIQIIDYALWEVIENGNSAPKTTVMEEDVNQKLLRSWSSKWNTHVVVWRNKPELETMSMDDLYNNLKVYEPEVKGASSSSTSTQNMDFVSSNNSGRTNEAVNTAHGVSAISTQVSAANSTNVDNLSDAVICAFFSSQPNNPQLANEDLQ